MRFGTEVFVCNLSGLGAGYARSRRALAAAARRTDYNQRISMATDLAVPTERIAPADEPRPRILRSTQLLRSATVKPSRNGLALTIFSRVVRPVASALAMMEAASAFSGAERIASAPARPAKCDK